MAKVGPRSGGRGVRLLILMVAVFTSSHAQPSRDFEFEDTNASPIDKPNLEATLLDDEDFRGDSPHGSGEAEGSADFSSPGPVRPTPSENPEYFRSTVNFTSLVYTRALGDRNSPEFQRQAREVSDAIESLFRSLPGEQVVTVLQFRPGSTDPRVTPSLIVTFDLGTVGFYNQLVLFNTLNNALNRGRLATYRVSPVGFTFRSLSVQTCPSVIGRAPGRLSQLGNNWADLMLNNIFQCDGQLKAFSYYRGNANGTAYIGIWRQAGHLQFVLKHKIALPPESVGVHTISLQNALTVAKGDFVGVHYSKHTPSGIIANSQPRHNEVPENEFFQTYNVMLFDEDIERMGRHIDVTLYDGGLLRKTFALQADIDVEILIPTAYPTEGSPTPTGPSTQKRTCSASEFTCWDGRCIETYRKCDGLPDCADGSDEVNCDRKCEVTEFQCANGQCIDGPLRCNRQYDCADSSDELNCACGPAEFRCTNGLCIDERRRCDGRQDCDDNGDEADCGGKEPTCSPFEFMCPNSRCIDVRRMCDSNDDCGDGADELDCAPLTCSLAEFTCQNGRCIDVRRKCDRRDDCGDGSDEQNCVEECTESQFKCADGTCIESSRRCDRNYDCSDYSDERNCPPPTCAPGQFRCDSGECIYDRSRCDGRRDCRDNSDEESCGRATCSSRQFTCNSGTCIDKAGRCDGRYDCDDYSDERECPEKPRCQAGQFECGTRHCIDSQLKCDGRPDCPDSSDERGCPPAKFCQTNEFRCDDGRECIDIRRKCDGRSDCRDGSDEFNCAARCSGSQFQCGSGECLPSLFRCNGRRDCRDGSDENRCPSSSPCYPDQFVCHSGQCVEEGLVCNFHWDCTDGTDEVNCPTECRPEEFRCADGQCIQARLRCNRRYECPDHSDERNCSSVPRCGRGEFQCRSGECLLDTWRCNGRRECRDGSDELGCRTTPTTVTVSPTQLRVREGQEVVFQCRSTGNPAPLVRWTKGSRSLPGGASDVNGRLTIRQADLDHSGDYTCTAIGVSGGPQATARLVVEVYGPTEGPGVPGQCGREEATCQNGQCISRDYICDGDFDCSDRSDEANCINPLPCEPNEFQCNNGKCAQKIWRCDGDDDCGDNSDELNCPTSDPNAVCRLDEYQCLAGDQCIPASYQCDGEIDCQDRSDEIGCASPTVIRPPPEMAMAERGETIVIECEAIGVPTPLIVWRLNWGHIGKPPRVSSTSEGGHGVLTIRQAQEEDEGAYTCEAINNKGSIFAQPDTIVTVKAPTGICRSPFFNAEAGTLQECIRCFCFDNAEDCVSSNLFRSQIVLSGAFPLVRRDTRDPLPVNLVQELPLQREYAIRDYSNRISGDYYWSLPSQFLGNRLTSYGSPLDYTVSYESRGVQPNDDADVIIHGNSITLYHHHFPDRPLRSGVTEAVSIPLTEGEWTKKVGDTGDSTDQSRASRPELMMVLQNLEYVLIKSRYDNNQNEVRIGSVSLGTGVVQDMGLGRAVLVEECSCPTGYSGHSCDQCASGFRRIQTGQYLGQCVPCQCNGHSNDCDQETGQCRNCQHKTEGDRCERCVSGTYGDALKGTASDCLACPCPLTEPRNQFSKECRLDNDEQVTCTNCPEGYEGRRCDRCAPGYQGNPMSPGDRCRRVGGVCDSVGSLSETPDSRSGQCVCKRNVQGPACDTCRENTFFLDASNPDGCLACFCMGVTTRCSSSGWYRAQIGATFASGTQGFSLTDSNQQEKITQGLRVNPREQELIFRDFANLDERDTVYYWSLPQKFLGNKVASYGGSLRYTVQYVPGFDTSPNDDPDIQMTGNNIALTYRHSQAMTSDTRMAISVPFTEQYWQRLDGASATREYMLMVLANLESIIVKATYTGNTAQTSIRDISMDIAESRRPSGERAMQVEQCSCPAGYTGLSCEECDIGYRRSGGGLYLGLCERCHCNGHSTECDTRTGQCSNCQHNTEGSQCERCAAGYYGDSTRGTANDCLRCPCPLANPPNQFSRTCILDRDGLVTCTACPQGYEGRRCDRCSSGYEGNPLQPGSSCRRTGGGATCSCDPAGTVPGGRCDPTTSQCQCKRHVEGRECNRCRAGHYNLDEANEDGCAACWCSGLTTQCASSTYYRDQIRPVYATNDHNFVLTTRRLGRSISDGFEVNPATNSITFKRFSDVQQPRESLFWHLPPRFRGNQITSYGGYLKFKLQFSVAYDSGETYPDVDVEILSGDDRYFVLFNPPAQVEALNKYELRLHEDTFRNLNRQPVTREGLLRVLANIDAILIRSTYHTIMASSTLRDVSLDTGVPQNTGQEQLTSMESCQCPDGYSGTSCEQCAVGYNMVLDNRGGSRCVACSCYGHGSGCDAVTGSCTGCKHNTVGDRCERCAPGFYGDATVGTPNDCRPCTCPLTLPSNNFSPTCFLDTDGRPTCDACRPGYTGRDCGTCAASYSGNPRQAGGTCVPSGGDDGIPVITITPHRIIENVGGTLIIRVRITGREPYARVEWIRADGRPLPDRSSVGPDHSLTIRNLQTSDSGRYILIVVNVYGTSRSEVDVNVRDDNAIEVVVQEPKVQTVDPGSTVRFVCTGISQVTYTLAWTRDTGEMDNRFEDDGRGVLTVRDVRRDDAGTFTCTGSNFYSLDTDKATIYVGVAEESPKVRIEPRYQTVQVGQPVEFRCIATGSPTPTLEWTGGRGRELSPESSFENGLFRISAARKSDESEYHCTATNTAGNAQVRTILYVEGDVQPTVDVKVEQPEVTVTYGGTARLVCTYHGNPSAVSSITWSRVGDPLPPGSRQENGILTISNTQPDYSGRYVCSIVLRTGPSGAGYVVLTVTRTGPSERPTVTIDPERQTVGQGSTATLRCIVTGSPAPSVRWSKVREELGTNHQVVGNVLRITRTRVEDRGLYMCEAENAAGSARAAGIVEVERREIPEIEIYPQPLQTISSGSSALFQCRITSGIPTPTVKWSRANGEAMAGNTEVLDNGVIRFLNVDGSEQGSYVCTATNTGGTVTATATLRISGRPRVTFSRPTPLRVEEGQRVSVECAGEGDPPPTVYWRYPRRVHTGPAGPEAAPRGRGSAVLDISSVSQSNAGVYYCISENRAGQSEGRFEIIVVPRRGGGGGRPPRIDNVPKDPITVVQGGTVDLRCTASGTPTPTVRWSRRDGPLPPDHAVSGGLLRITRMRPEYAGEYVCTISNVDGSTSASFYLAVQASRQENIDWGLVGPSGVRICEPRHVRCQSGECIHWSELCDGQVDCSDKSDEQSCGPRPPSLAPSVVVSPPSQTVRPGDRITLQCRGQGTQPITIQWSKVIGSLSPSARERDGTLEISPVTAADSGRYRCIAVNAGGRAEAYVDVVVSVPPTAVVTPRSLTKTVGETVELRCESTGRPVPRLQWVREAGPLPEQHGIRNGVLTIYRVAKEDQGRYICIATNEIGSNQDYASLIVDSGGAVIPGGNGGAVSERRETVRSGYQVELSCEIEGNQRASIRWEKVGGRLPASSIVRGNSLVIQRVELEDAGTYRCVATSALGSVYSNIVLTVEGSPVFRVSRQERSASVGARVVLSCVAYGQPQPSVTWSRVGAPLPREHEAENGNLIIPALRPEDFGEYKCTASNRYGQAEASVILTQGELVPRFLQDPSSYITFETLPEAYFNFDVEMALKPEATDGLILYNGQMATGEGDFMALGMREGRMEFRFDVGSGPAIIRSAPIDLGKWHTVRVKRDHKDGTLVVDGMEYKGQAQGSFAGLDLVENLYVGGVPDYNSISVNSGFTQGFIGGISRIEINGQPLSIGDAALSLKGIVDYPVCAARPCQNGGTCRPASSEFGYQCFCRSGYSGQRCELIGERCFEAPPGACGKNGRCYDLPNMGYRCACPVGRTGNRCEKGVVILLPAFNKTSFIAYPTIRDGQQTVQISMMIQPASLADSLLLYNAQDDAGRGDFISLALRNGKVEFRYDSGSGPATITSDESLRVGEWATIVAERNERDGSLSVNGGVAVKGQSPEKGVSDGSTIGLNLKGSLYLGGVDPNVRVARGVGIDTGFVGCVSELIIKGTAQDLLNDAIASANILNCGDTSPCSKRPCQNRGVCQRQGDRGYLCRCGPGYSGVNCEREENICTTTFPCQNNGVCEPLDGTFRCRCPIGFAGHTCNIVTAEEEEHEPVLPSSGDGSIAMVTDAALFSGDGFMELPGDLLTEYDEQVLQFGITTARSDGLILWHGQERSVSGRGKDFVAVAINNGHVLFSYELGSGRANITSAIRVDDGRPHTIRATRTGKRGSLELDDFTITEGSSAGDASMLNAAGSIFIGGVPDADLMTDGAFRRGFVGCITEVYIGETGPIDFSIDATGGMSVQPCVV